MSHGSDIVLWEADWVCPGPSACLEKGIVASSRRRVLTVGERVPLRHAWPGEPVLHKGRVMGIPPANAHVHLDLTNCPPFRGPYPDFIWHVIAHRGTRGAEAARAGLAALHEAGAGAFGDIVASPEAMEALLAESDLPGVLYWEVIGPDPSRAEAIFRDTAERVDRWRRRDSVMRVGVSPHTGHTVSAPLLRKIAAWARVEDVPLQIHAAESPEETVLYQNGTGPLADFLQEVVGLAWEAPGCSPVAFLADTGILFPGTAVVHAVQTDEADRRILADAGVTVVTCPRSNRALQVGDFPWEAFRRAGVPVALGTDSAASAGSLDLREDIRPLWNRLGPDPLLEALTETGYRLLGVPRPRITAGSSVDTIWVFR